MMEKSNSMFICGWHASYYDGKSPQKQWKYGIMKLYFGKVLFYVDQQSQRGRGPSCALKFEIPFSEIVCFKKASSSLIFPAIAILTTINEKHWFSSFANRDETLLFIEHFFHSSLWQDELTKSVPRDMNETGAQSTEIGKELLRSVVDSNKTLAAAGSQLDEQGQQLRNASVKMVEMNHDLDVASRFTQGLKSWLPRWRVPKSYDQDPFLVLTKEDAMALNICSFNALFRDVSKGSKGLLLPCVIAIDKKGISIMDDFQKHIQHFKWSDISRVQMVGVWELSITQYFIGKPDRKCTAVSVRVREILKQIEKFRPDKIEPISPDVISTWSQHDMQIREQHGTFNDTSETQQHSSRPSGLQSQQSLVAPSSREMIDLSKELTSLKSIALDVQKEQDEQLKEIEELTTAVTKGTDRLSKLDRTMNKML